MFKVVPDQLKVSDGWVRCGHCTEVFDATAQLQQPESTAQSAVAAPRSEPVDTLVPTASAYSPVLLTRASDEESAGARVEPDGDALVPEPWAQALDDTEPVPLLQVPQAPPLRQAQRPPPAPPESDAQSRAAFASEADPDSEPESVLDDLGFVQQARRRSYWQRPQVRSLLQYLAPGLVVLLALQFGVAERDWLAARQPWLRPLLEMVCAPRVCAIGPPRQIEAIVIDSSAFSKLRSDAYRLNFTLKNQSALPVAFPAMELTLTDTQDQPVVRRVLSPQELGAGSGVIAAGSEWPAALALSVAASGTAARIAGYRLLAFYP